MELELVREELIYQKPVFRGSLVKEESAELVVPDALPDVLRVVGVTAVPLLRAKEVQAGRLTVSGVCDAAILYVPEDAEGVERLAASVPFTFARDIPGLTENARTVADLRLISAEARLIHARKLVLRLELCAQAAAFEQERLTTAVGAVGEVQLLTCEAELTLPVAVNEKTFSLTDTVSAGRERVGRLLGSRVAFRVGEVKPLGEKFLVRGEALTTVLTRGEGDAPVSRTFRSPFSQIVDLDAEEECAPESVTVTPTGVYITTDMPTAEGEEGISLEIHGVIQCVALGERKVRYLKDAYSLRAPLTLEREPLCLTSVLKPRQEELLASGSFATPQEVESIAAFWADAGEPVLSPCEQGLRLTVPVGMAFLYTSRAGELFGLNRRTELETLLREEPEVQTKPIGLLPLSWEAEQNATPEGLAARVGLLLTLSRLREVRDEMVVRITCEEGETLSAENRPSLVAYRVRPGDTLWEIAKRFTATREAVTALNTLSEEPVAPGTLLLIPRVS